MKQGTVVRQIEKINDNIIMLTEAGLYIYKNNFVNKLLDDFGEFKIFKIDSKGNIYIDTKKRGFLKCTPVNENYDFNFFISGLNVNSIDAFFIQPFMESPIRVPVYRNSTWRDNERTFGNENGCVD